jgi:hypothetical protein
MNHPSSVHPLSSCVDSHLPFSRYYLEAVLDCLLDDFNCRQLQSKWWPQSSFKSLIQSCKLRRGVWKAALPSAVFPPPDADRDLKDEALWQIASYLKKLYGTISAAELPPGPLSLEELPLVELRDDRYQLDLAVSRLPAATARAVLPRSTWESLLHGLCDSIFTDFLLSLIQEHVPDLTVSDLLRRMGEIINRQRARRQRPPVGDWYDQWVTYLSLPAEASEATDIRLGTRLSHLTYALLDDTMAGLLSHLPEEIQRDAMLSHEFGRIALLQDALAAELSSGHLPDQSCETLVLRYLAVPGRRIPLEERAAGILLDTIRGADYEVVLPMRGYLERSVPTGDFGFTLTNQFPVPGIAVPAGAVMFAYFPRLGAASQAEAAHEARRRLAVVISAVGVSVRASTAIEILDAHTRRHGSVGWGFFGRRAALSFGEAGGTSLAPILAELGAISQATDDLGDRIREALIHLHRAETSYDAEDRLDEAWKVLEIIGEYATKRAEALLCYLPLYLVQHDFDLLNGKKKIEAIRSKYRRILDAFTQVKDARNDTIAHRRMARADWKVLGHHSEWALSFARDVLFGAFAGWTSGARRPRDLEGELRNAYEKRFHFRLPNPSELRQ